MERKDLNTLSIVILFLLISYLSFIILRSFLIPLFIGAIIAYIIYPFHSRLAVITKSGRFSAIILSLITITIIITLSALIIPGIVTEWVKLYESSEKIILKQFEELGRCSQDPEDLRCKLVVYMLDNVDEETLKDTGITITRMISDFIMNNIIAFFENLPNLVLQLIIILFSTFYFLNNGKGIVDCAVLTLPIMDSHKSRIKKRIDDVMKAIIFGNLMTAFIEGLIATIIFLFLGINMPFVWGLLIMFFALIPPFGAAVIWAPAVIILFIIGEYTKAIILAVLCLSIMGYIDNILRPSMISKKVRLSSLWVLLGVLGGIGTFGFAGIFIGPLILALFVTLLTLVGEELIEDEK